MSPQRWPLFVFFVLAIVATSAATSESKQSNLLFVETSTTPKNGSAPQFNQIELISSDVQTYALSFAAGNARPLSASFCPFQTPTRKEALLCDSRTRILSVIQCTGPTACKRIGGLYAGRSPGTY